MSSRADHGAAVGFRQHSPKHPQRLRSITAPCPVEPFFRLRWAENNSEGGDLQHIFLPIFQKRVLVDREKSCACRGCVRRHGLRQLHHETGKFPALFVNNSVHSHFSCDILFVLAFVSRAVS